MRQIREIVAFERPTAAPRLRVLHSVRVGGGVSSVRVITSTTRSSVTVRGTPGRGSSVNPASRRTRKRSRHLQTQLLDTASRSATARLVSPSAQASTIRDRTATRCAVVGRRAHWSNVRRSSSVNSNGLWWRFLCMARTVPRSPRKYKTISETGH